MSVRIKAQGLEREVTRAAVFGELVCTLPLVDPTGTTDSSVGLQKVLDLGLHENRSVYIPAGTYILSNTVYLDGPFVVRGAGVAKTRLRAAVSNMTMFAVAARSNSFYSSLNDLQIDGMGFADTGVVVGSSKSSCGSGFVWRDLYITHFLRNAVDLVRAEIGVFEHCTFSSSGVGINSEAVPGGAYNTDMKVLDSAIHNNDVGIYLQWADGFTVRDCTIQNNRCQGVYADIASSRGTFANRIQLVGNWIEGNGTSWPLPWTNLHADVVFNSPNTNNPSSSTLISENQFAHNGTLGYQHLWLGVGDYDLNDNVFKWPRDGTIGVTNLAAVVVRGSSLWNSTNTKLADRGPDRLFNRKSIRTLGLHPNIFWDYVGASTSGKSLSNEPSASRWINVGGTMTKEASTERTGQRFHRLGIEASRYKAVPLMTIPGLVSEYVSYSGCGEERTNEAEVFSICPQGQTVSNVWAHAGTPLNAGTVVVVTLMTNDVASNFSFKLVGSSTTASNLVDSVMVRAGTRLSWKISQSTMAGVEFWGNWAWTEYTIQSP